MSARRRELRVIGLLSGTSMDGVDAAAVRIAGGGPGCRVELERFRTFPCPPRDRARLHAAAGPGRRDAAEIARLDVRLGELFARAARKVANECGGAHRIDLIGSHGQTLLHLPRGREGASVQSGSGAVIARRTGIPVVHDFRAADVAAGGEGAPLLPLADYLLFGGGRAGRVILNIGGIANLTFLPARGAWDETKAYDTGPGNALVDRIVVQTTGGARRFDRGGKGAARGAVDRAMLDRLMAHPFLRMRPPRSTGTEEFGDALARRLIRMAERRGMAREDLLATVTEFTAASAGREVARRLRRSPGGKIFVCGGGARNAHMVRRLEAAVGAPVRPVDDLGIPAEAREAVGFALLASEFVRGNRYAMKHITGARGAPPLGLFAPSERSFVLGLPGGGGGNR